jgi:hypothetical protein
MIYALGSRARYNIPYIPSLAHPTNRPLSASTLLHGPRCLGYFEYLDISWSSSSSQSPHYASHPGIQLRYHCELAQLGIAGSTVRKSLSRKVSSPGCCIPFCQAVIDSLLTGCRTISLRQSDSLLWLRSHLLCKWLCNVGPAKTVSPSARHSRRSSTNEERSVGLEVIVLS